MVIARLAVACKPNASELVRLITIDLETVKAIPKAVEAVRGKCDNLEATATKPNAFTALLVRTIALEADTAIPIEAVASRLIVMTLEAATSKPCTT